MNDKLYSEMHLKLTNENLVEFKTKIIIIIYLTSN